MMQNQELVEELVRRVPEFLKEEDQWHSDLPYDAFGTFALFLSRKIREGASEDLLQRAFSLLNEMAVSRDDDVRNLLVAGVLEVIVDDAQVCAVAERQLNESGGNLLRSVRDGWNESLS